MAATAQAAPSKIAVMPLEVDATAKGLVPDLLDDVILTAVQQASADEVIGANDITAILGFEKQKELLGCDDVTCLAEIGGALGADKLMVIKLARLSGDWVCTTKIINMRTAGVESRASNFVKGDAKELIQAIPQIIKRLLAGGGMDTGPVSAAPTQTLGGLEITTVPPGSECWIDGAKRGESPCVLGDLTAGRHTVEVRKQYYQSAGAAVNVIGGHTQKLAYTLEPAPVQVQIQPTPNDAQVLIDGRELTERTLSLPPGSYALVMERDDYTNLTQTLTVPPGPPLTLNLALEPGYSDAQLSSRQQRLVWGIVFATLAAGAGAVAAWQATEAQGAVDHLRTLPAGSDEIAGTINYGQTSAAVADGMFVGGGVSMAIATSLLVSLAF